MTEATINDTRGRTLWDKLRLYGRLSTSVAGVEFKVSVPLKYSRPRQPAQPKSRSQKPSAAKQDPAVKALRQRLQQHGFLVAEWEAAGQRVSDELLWRWLKARGGVEETERCLLQHARWRINLGPITEAAMQRELDAEKVFLQGCDVQGRPVVVVLAARHVITRRSLEETKKLITFTLETAIAAADPVKNPLSQILCLFDLSGLGLGNLDTRALQAVFEVLQQHFPESLSELWFLNAPFIFWGLWRVVKPFIQPGTRDKIRFLSGSERAALLSHNLSKQVLPKCYGGSADLISIEQAADRIARQVSAEAATNASGKGSSKAENTGRLAIVKRFVSKAVLGTWGFAKDHNPVWAARTFGSGVKRAVLAIPRPGRHSQMNQHATLLAERVSSAWQQRPSLPRPNYRYQRRTDSVHLALLDVVAFYVIAVSVVALAVLLCQQWFLSSHAPAVF